MLLKSIQTTSQELLNPVRRRKACSPAYNNRVCAARTELLKAKEAFLFDSCEEKSAVVADMKSYSVVQEGFLKKKIAQAEMAVNRCKNRESWRQ